MVGKKKEKQLKKGKARKTEGRDLRSNFKRQKSKKEQGEDVTTLPYPAP